MNMEIIRDGQVDPSEIEGLREAVGWDRSEGNLERILAAHAAHYTVRDGDGLLVGYVSVLSDGIADALLLDLIVRPECHHKGIGTRLVRRAIGDMKEAGIQCVHVTFEDHLQPFYAQCGLGIIKAGIVDFKNMKWEVE